GACRGRGALAANRERGDEVVPHDLWNACHSPVADWCTAKTIATPIHENRPAMVRSKILVVRTVYTPAISCVETQQRCGKTVAHRSTIVARANEDAMRVRICGSPD